MSLSQMAALALVTMGLAACSGPTPPSSFSNAVRTGSGIGSTGSAGPGGGAGGAPSNTGAVTTTTVR